MITNTALVTTVLIVCASATIIAIAWASVMREKWLNNSRDYNQFLALERSKMEFNNRAFEIQKRQVDEAIKLAKQQRSEGEEWRADDDH